MVALRDLQPASFRGVSFLVPRDHAEHGVNVVTHRYPGKTSGHYMEPNGVFEPVFHVHAVLHGPNLMGQYAALQSALNAPMPGTLKHPWHGSQLVIPKHPWKVSRDDKDSGVLTLDITFHVAGSPAYPSIITGIASSISALSGGVIGSIFSGLASTLAIPSSPFSQAFMGHLMSGVAGNVASQFPATAAMSTAADAIGQVSLPSIAAIPSLSSLAAMSPLAGSTPSLPGPLASVMPSIRF